MTEKQITQCRERLQRFLAEMLNPLGRRERCHWGSIYVRGLLLDGERKSVGAMVSRLPDGNEQNLQQARQPKPVVVGTAMAKTRAAAESSFHVHGVDH